MKLTNVTQLVRTILTDTPETRDDDYLLWLESIQRVARNNNIPDISKIMTVGDYLKIAKYSQMPHYESVSRARRRLQEKYPELRGSSETQSARAELEQEYREYARGRI